MINHATTNREAVSARALSLFQQAESQIHQRTDRMFAKLMVFQWLAGIIAAVWISPKTWIGATSEVHLHVWAAIFLGGAIASFPIFMVLKYPGTAITRHTIAVAQMLFSSLLIHLSGGRVETHFHVFGSLAFLAFYRDWRVLISATVVVALDHFLRGTFWPQSVFGIMTASPWRWMEHAAWVLFEDFFLLISIRQSLADMFGLAERQASLEAVNAGIEATVEQRTRELTQENAERKKAENALRESTSLYLSLVEQLPISVYRKDAEGRYVFVNSLFCQLKGKTAEQILGQTADAVLSGELAERSRAEHETIMRTGETLQLEEFIRTAGGYGMRFFHVVKLPVLNSEGQIVGTQGVQFDITERKEAVEKLQEAHKQLMDVSRRAGMAEVATSVLHNVGNVLNSVNVSSSLIVEKVRQSRISNLTRAAELIQAHDKDLAGFFTNDPKGQQLPAYLLNLADHVTKEQQEIAKEAEVLVKNIMHIKEIVSMQQSYAKTSGVTEMLKIQELVDDAVRMNDGSIERHNLKLLREYTDVPAILTDKHKVLQILVNLIRNAKHACDDSGSQDKRITLRVTNGDSTVKVSVIDNGVGIPAENLSRIFNHGFTTRKNGHGYGLHSGALAARELGGSLNVSSEGAGRGATFTLELPMKLQKVNE
jgi:PAS domain S-box-containing protein